ncbi:DNA transfer protein [Serratia marcescens]|uniref:DNA transfer protein n=1 Tax=Serratia marcescens TaxID=615 RepID=UPI0038928815
MKVTANGKTFTFPDGTSTEDIGAAIDDYFAGQSAPAAQEAQPATPAVKEPTMLDNAEQAARGLVNIPFDVLQGGASLINAISQGLGGPKVLDDVYRPVDRPTDPYAQAGEAIGGYLTPGVGIAGNMALGALAEASNQQGDFAENAAKNAAINLGAQGALSAIGKVVGRGVTAARGKIAPEARQAIDFAEKNNAPLLTTDVATPGTFTGRSAQALGEKIPVTGTGGVRRGQQEARNRLVQNYAQQFDAVAPEEIVGSLQRQTNRVKQAAGQRLTQVNDAMQSAGVIDPVRAVASIDKEISSLSRLGAASDAQTIGKLQTYRDELSKGADFGLLRDLRTQFRQDVKGDRVAWPNQSQAAVNRVYAALTDDISSAVTENLGAKTAYRYKQANAVYANEAQLVNNTRLKNVLQKGELTPEIVNNLLFSNKPSEVRQLYRSLDARGRNAARSSVIGKAYEKSGGSPDKFLNEVNRLSSQTGILFKGSERQYLNGLTKYLDQTRRAARAGAVTQTGQELFQVAVPAGVVSDVLGTGGVATGAALSYGALARAYESRMFRNAMLKLANTKAGSPTYERILNQAADAARPLVANQITQE